MDNQELDKLFRDTIGDFREDPDPGVWSRIRATLDRDKRTRRLVPFWYRLGIAAAVLLGAVFLLAPREDTDPTGPAVGTEAPVASSPGNGQQPSQTQGAAMPTPPEVRPGGAQEVQAQEEEIELAGKHLRQAERPAAGNRLNNEATTSPAPLASAPEKPSPAPVGEERNRALQEAVTGQPLLAGDRDRKEPVGTTALPEAHGQEEEAAAALTDLGEEEPSIFEALEEKDDPMDTGRKGPRWSVGPSVAPVYFSSFGDGSPISSSFVPNEKSGSFNMSYGLQVAYGVSKKLSLRTGIHRVDYGYNTEEIGFTASPVGSGNSLIRTINYSEDSRDLVVKSMVNGSRQPDSKEAIDVTAPSPVREGRMVQEFGYLEIPLEMQYSLIDKTWGVNLIGGMSSLFLVNNSVSLESSGAVTEVGEAANMNPLNFSTNFGVGVYYRLGQNMELNVLPMFKYQLNTFSNTSGNFRPYSIGVYSGLNFRF